MVATIAKANYMLGEMGSEMGAYADRTNAGTTTTVGDSKGLM